MTIKIPVSSVTNRLTVNIEVTGLRVWRVRLWLGTHLIGLAARVMGCNIHVDIPK
jgi:hypothetical protein